MPTAIRMGWCQKHYKGFSLSVNVRNVFILSVMCSYAATAQSGGNYTLSNVRVQSTSAATLAISTCSSPIPNSQTSAGVTTVSFSVHCDSQKLDVSGTAVLTVPATLSSSSPNAGLPLTNLASPAAASLSVNAKANIGYLVSVVQLYSANPPASMQDSSVPCAHYDGGVELSNTSINNNDSCTFNSLAGGVSPFITARLWFNMRGILYELDIFATYAISPGLSDGLIADAGGCTIGPASTTKITARDAVLFATVPRDAGDSTFTDYARHLQGVAGAAKPGTGKITLSCAAANPNCTSDYAIAVKTLSGGDWLKLSSLKGPITGANPAAINVTADPSQLTAAGSPYVAELTITGSFNNSPFLRRVIFDVSPPCTPKLEISNEFPKRGATIWAAEVKPPVLTAAVNYSAPLDTEVAIELVDGLGNLLNVGDATIPVKAGQGTVNLVISPTPLSAFHVNGDSSQPTYAFVRAAFSNLGPDGQRIQAGGTPFRSDTIYYAVAAAPQLITEIGCKYNGSFGAVAATDVGFPIIPEVICWPAIRVTSTFSGPKQAQLTVDRAQYFGTQLKADDLLPPVTVAPDDPPQVFPLSKDTRAYLNGVIRNNTDLGRADRVQARVLLRNPETGQLVISDQRTVGFERIRIGVCSPDPAKDILRLASQDIACVVEYSIWNNERSLERGVSLNATFLDFAKTEIRPLASMASEKFVDQFNLGSAPAAISSPSLLYTLRDDRGVGKAYDLVTFWRTSQSLDDAVNFIGKDKVAQFASGQLRFANGLGLPGKLGNIVKNASEMCSGSDKLFDPKKALTDLAMVISKQETDCASKLIAGYRLLTQSPSSKPGSPRFAAAPPVIGMAGIASTWAFDNPITKGAGLQADLTLTYSADQLPDRSDFDESQLKVVSYDPASGVAEVLSTTLDTTAKTATAHLDHLAPYYSLAMVGPLANTQLRSPLVLAGSSLLSGLALANLGTTAANVTLAAFSDDGTPLGNGSKLQIGQSAQQGGLASDLFGSADQQVSGSLQVTSDQPGVTGVHILGGSGLLDILPLESTASDMWVLSLVEQTAIYNTQVHVANNANYATNVQFDLRTPDGTSIAAYGADLPAKGKLALGINAIFPDLQIPFSGYLTVSAGQKITAAAVLLSTNAVAAIAGKVPPAGTGAGKLYGPLMGGAPYASAINLVNLDSTNAKLVIHGYKADGTEAAPAVNLTLGPLNQYTKDLVQVFGADPGPVALVVETSTLGVVGDVVLSDSTPADRYRTSIALTPLPLTSLVLPYASNDGNLTTSLSISNSASAAATAKVTLFATGGTSAANATLKVPAHGSAVGSLSALLPGAAGVSGGYLTVTSDQTMTAMALIDPGVHDIAAVAALPVPGTIAPPGPSAIPVLTAATGLDFGNVTVGQTKTMQLLVSNTGNAPLIVSGLTGLGAPFTAQAALPLTIAAGAQQNLPLTFAPSAAGAATRKLTIASNDPVRATFDLNLTGSGVVASSPSISVVGTLDLGSVTVGQSKTASLAIANTGNASLLVNGLSGLSAPFAVQATLPLTIAPSGQQNIQVSFTPTAAGGVNGKLTIVSNDTAHSPVTISITGIGVAAAAPVISVPAALDFGSSNVAQSKTLPLIVSNTGTAPLTITGLTGLTAPFSGPTALPPAVPPGGQQTINLNFIPTAAGPASGILTIASNDPGRPKVTVALSGTGVAVVTADTKSGLVAWWKFDEPNGSGIGDSSGNGNAGTPSAGVTRVASGKFGAALNFNGTTGAVDGAGAGAQFPLNYQPRTISAWVNVTGPPLTYDNGIFHYGTASGAGPYNFHLYLFGNTGKVGLGNGYGFGTISGTTNVVDGQWHHVAGVYEGASSNTARIYVDGVLQTADKLATIPNTGTGTPWRIGAFQGAPQGFKGLMDDVRVYNRPLSAIDIQALAAGQ